MANDGNALEVSCKRAIARFYKDSKVIGAGILVEGGYVLTCAHVVKKALGLDKAKKPIGQKLNIDFPYALPPKVLSAQVVIYKLIKNDTTAEDIAGLQLLDDIPDTIKPANIARGHYPGMEFGALGFPEGHKQGIGSYGELKDELPYGWVQIEGVKTQGHPIEPGFSGTAIWDPSSDTVVGMAVARDKNTPEEKVAFMIPARKLLATVRHLETLELKAILDIYETELATAITTAYQLCRPEGYLPPIPDDDLAGKLNNLKEMKPNQKGYQAIDQFVALLTSPVLNSNQKSQQELCRWLELRVDNLQVLREYLNPLLLQQMTVASAAVESHVLIYVPHPIQVTEEYSVKVFFIPDGNKYDAKSGAGQEEIYVSLDGEKVTETINRTSLEGFVQACLETVSARYPENLMVHLILPPRLMNIAFETWSLMGDEPILPGVALKIKIGEQYRLVIRIAARLYPKIFYVCKKQWQSNWDKLAKLNPGELRNSFLSGEACWDISALEQKWKTDQYLGLKLPSVLTPKQYKELFSMIIEFGIPAAIWLRYDQFSNGLECHCELDALLSCRPEKLPELIRDVRSKATTLPVDTHIGHHLSFLWEDPNLIPPNKMLGLA